MRHYKKLSPYAILANSARIEARKLCMNDKCYFNDAVCKGRVCVHHCDGNPFNNSDNNLLPVCSAHHSLLHQIGVTKELLLSPDFSVFMRKGGGARFYSYEVDRIGNRSFGTVNCNVASQIIPAKCPFCESDVFIETRRAGYMRGWCFDCFLYEQEGGRQRKGGTLDLVRALSIALHNVREMRKAQELDALVVKYSKEVA